MERKGIFFFQINVLWCNVGDELHLRQKLGNSGNFLIVFSRGSQIIISNAAEHHSKLLRLFTANYSSLKGHQHMVLNRGSRANTLPWSGWSGAQRTGLPPAWRTLARRSWLQGRKGGPDACKKGTRVNLKKAGIEDVRRCENQMLNLRQRNWVTMAGFLIRTQ